MYMYIYVYVMYMYIYVYVMYIYVYVYIYIYIYIYTARCDFSNKTFRIRNRHISNIQQHPGTEKHVKNEKEMKKTNNF